MIVDTYKDYVCRTGELGDVQEMYDILEPLICDKTRHKFQYQTQQRRLKMVIKFYIDNKNSMVVLKGDEVVGVYLGENNFILHVATKHTDRKAMLLLGYNMLCVLQKEDVVSMFEPLTHQDAYTFRDNMFSEDTVTHLAGKSFVTVEFKQHIKALYNKLKGNS